MRQKPGNLKCAVAYIRVSTEEQKLGPVAQRTAIEAWAAQGGVTVVEWHEDAGVSGGSDIAARAGLVAALAALRVRRAGVFVVAKRDRLARDVYVAATIERAVSAAGAHVVAADGAGNGDAPADHFMRTVIDGAAAYERALIRARTCAALQAKVKRGERAGQIPYGSRLAADGVRLEQEPAEQAVIAHVRELRAAGLSLRAIVAECGLAGLVSRVGRPFAKTQITRMLEAA